MVAWAPNKTNTWLKVSWLMESAYEFKCMPKVPIGQLDSQKQYCNFIGYLLIGYRLGICGRYIISWLLASLSLSNSSSSSISLKKSQPISFFWVYQKLIVNTSSHPNIVN